MSAWPSPGGAERRIPPSATSPALTETRQIGHSEIITLSPMRASLPTSGNGSLPIRRWHPLWKKPSSMRVMHGTRGAPSTPKLPLWAAAGGFPASALPAAPTPRGTQPRVARRHSAVPAWGRCPAPRGHRRSPPTFLSGCRSQGKRRERAQPSRRLRPRSPGRREGGRRPPPATAVGSGRMCCPSPALPSEHFT